MQTFRRWLPWLVLTLGVLYVLGSMRPQSSAVDGFRLSGFGTLPILHNGRMMPIDTYARVELMMMNRRQEYSDPKDRSQPAIRWFLNLLADGMANTQGVVMLAPDVQGWLDLKARRGDGRVGIGQLKQALRGKQKEFAALVQKPDRGPLEQQVFMALAQAAQQEEIAKDLRQSLGEDNNPDAQKVFRVDFDQVLEMLRLKRRDGLRYSMEEITHEADAAKDEQGRQVFDAFLRKMARTDKLPREKLDTTDLRALELYKQLRTHWALASLQAVALVPDKDFSPGGWKTLGQAIDEGDPAVNPHAAHLEAMVLAYAKGKTKEFNAELDAYQKLVAAAVPAAAANARLEAWFSQFAPFYRCAALYMFVVLLAAGSWMFWPSELRLAAVSLLGLTLLVHTAALILRMYIQGRPPVTNLYSSAVFIGWGCSLVCFVMELINSRLPVVAQKSIPAFVAGWLGFSTMVIAHHLGGSGDTMEVLQAVLDTNFWLATHVTTVVLGYTATFVAGFIAIFFLWYMLATTVVAFFRNRGNPEWSNVGVFIASACGLVAVPGVFAVFSLWGAYYMAFGEDPFSAGVHVLMMLPVAVGCLIYATMLVVSYTSPEAGGQVPGMLSWADGIQLDVNLSKAFMNSIYGVTCLALLLSFVGTVLGGIWADQSWGRFWGWDPKENGAILVVIINAILLHARWGGLVKERGTVTISLVGNMVTMWSWFGTNQLGIGLHSYGFNNALIAMCTSFWVSQLALIGLASLPAKYWKAYTAVPQAKPAKGGRGR